MRNLILFVACLLLPACKYNLDRTWPDASAPDRAIATDQADSRMIQWPDKRPEDRRPTERPVSRQ
jgi:hypothetical protein